MRKVAIISTIAVLVLAACGKDRDQARAEAHFQYCIGAASPASADAIRACSDAAVALTIR